jgi:hypothetical protein
VNGNVSPYDVISPTITVCPSDTSVEGCSVENIMSASLLPFSTSPTAIAYSQFAAEGGAATDNCTLNSSIQIKYTDVLRGSCPLNVIRTFTVSDASQNIASCTQNILIHDSTPPLISSGNLESCYPLAGDAEQQQIIAVLL